MFDNVSSASVEEHPIVATYKRQVKVDVRDRIAVVIDVDTCPVQQAWL